MSHAPRGFFQRGTSVLAALVFVAVLSSVAYAVHEITIGNVGSQSAAVGGVFAIDETAPSQAAPASTPAPTASSKLKATFSKDSAERCVAPITVQQGSNVKLDAASLAQDVINTCVPGCDYEIRQSSILGTSVNARDLCAGSSAANCKTTQCIVQHCDDSGCHPADTGGVTPSAFLAQEFGVQSKVLIQSDPLVKSAVELAKEDPATAQQSVDQLSPLQQQAFQTAQTDAIAKNEQAIKDAAGLGNQSVVDGLEAENHKLTSVKVNPEIADTATLPTPPSCASDPQYCPQNQTTPANTQQAPAGGSTFNKPASQPQSDEEYSREHMGVPSAAPASEATTPNAGRDWTNSGNDAASAAAPSVGDIPPGTPESVAADVYQNKVDTIASDCKKEFSHCYVSGNQKCTTPAWAVPGPFRTVCEDITVSQDEIDQYQDRQINNQLNTNPGQAASPVTSGDFQQTQPSSDTGGQGFSGTEPDVPPLPTIVCPDGATLDESNQCIKTIPGQVQNGTPVDRIGDVGGTCLADGLTESEKLYLSNRCYKCSVTEGGYACSKPDGGTATNCDNGVVSSCASMTPAQRVIVQPLASSADKSSETGGQPDLTPPQKQPAVQQANDQSNQTAPSTPQTNVDKLAALGKGSCPANSSCPSSGSLPTSVWSAADQSVTADTTKTDVSCSGNLCTASPANPSEQKYLESQGFNCTTGETGPAYCRKISTSSGGQGYDGPSPAPSGSMNCDKVGNCVPGNPADQQYLQSKGYRCEDDANGRINCTPPAKTDPLASAVNKATAGSEKQIPPPVTSEVVKNVPPSVTPPPVVPPPTNRPPVYVPPQINNNNGGWNSQSLSQGINGLMQGMMMGSLLSTLNRSNQNPYQYPYQQQNAACPAAPVQPPASQCNGTWEPQSASVGGQSCTVGWMCSTANNPTAKIDCSPLTADDTASISITYSCGNAFTSSGHNFITGGATSGQTSTVLPPLTSGSNTIAFGVQCSNAQGQSATASCSVNVTHAAIVMVANPPTIAAGQQSTIGWVTTGMQSCVVSSSEDSAFTLANATSTSVSGSAKTSTLTATAHYALTCTTIGGGAKTASSTVTVR